MLPLTLRLEYGLTCSVCVLVCCTSAQVHEPCVANVGGNLHPVSRLFERPFSLHRAKQEHLNFVKLMQAAGVKAGLRDIDVRDLFLVLSGYVSFFLSGHSTSHHFTPARCCT